MKNNQSDWLDAILKDAEKKVNESPSWMRSDAYHATIQKIEERTAAKEAAHSEPMIPQTWSELATAVRAGALRRWRIQHRPSLTLSAIARSVGISFNHAWRSEMGRCVPRPAILAAWLRLLGLEPPAEAHETEAAQARRLGLPKGTVASMRRRGVLAPGGDLPPAAPTQTKAEEAAVLGISRQALHKRRRRAAKTV